MNQELSAIKSLYDNLINQDIIKFPEPRKPLDAVIQQGVYIIRSPKGKVLHVGRTLRAKNGLWQRLYNHLNGLSSFVYQYLNQNGARLREGYTFQYLVVSNSRKRALLEAYAIANLCPEHIGLGEE